MANIISDETIEYIGILAKLELSGQEKEQARSDMGRMLDYIDRLGELDTSAEGRNVRGAQDICVMYGGRTELKGGCQRCV